MNTGTDVSDCAVGNEALMLASVGLQISLPQIYEDVVFPNEKGAFWSDHPCTQIIFLAAAISLIIRDSVTATTITFEQL